MKRLLVSGDSWTSCWPLEERLGHREFGWPNLVSKKINFHLIDKSRAGSSNYRIFRKAFDGIISGECDLVLVFLTNWTRFETGSTYGDKPGRIYQHLPKQKDSATAFKLFFNGYKNYTDMLRFIITLQSMSSLKNIPCYFLDTYDQNLYLDISLEDFKEILNYNPLIFENMDDARIIDKFNKVKLLESAIKFDNFISTDSYEKLIKGSVLDNGHPGTDGHEKIAKVVINFLESKNHGKTI